MTKNYMYLFLVGAASLTTVPYVQTAIATPASLFTGTTIAMGRVGDIDVFNQQVIHAAGASDRAARAAEDVWISMQKTKGSSDVYVQSNVWQPGGSTGWHTHPGHSIIIVTAGTVTDYEGSDPACKPTVYTQGMTFVDSGGDHVHLIRNEGTVPASTMAVQIIPAGAARRIDAPDPGTCHF
jgi:quercetin dioxygenase-like cupin family protein